MYLDAESVIKDLKTQWGKHVNINKILDDWLDACKDGGNKISKARQQFHQWNPLRVYVSVGKARLGNKPIFSLRFWGQEVAELLVATDNKVLIRLKEKHINSGPLGKCGSYHWDEKEAKDFRKFFKNQNTGNGCSFIKSDSEHRIESKIIEEMLRKERVKFGGCGLRIQPVRVGNCPLQFPVPFSANKGTVDKGPGHIDILARRKGKDNKVRLSVWELKRPNVYKQAGVQAYIYALQLLYILRSKRGKEWYKIFGFNGDIPKRLEIEAVVAITEKQKGNFNKDKEKFGEINVNGDSIKLYGAFYEEDQKSGGIILNEGSFQGDM